jgi:O-antigen ligase
MFIGSSRGITSWFGGYAPSELDQYLDGSPVDRLILSGLQIAGILVLFARGRKTRRVLRANAPLLLFFGYCALSISWSDFPFVAFKRWIKAAGNVVMVLLVLTDRNTVAAIKRTFARTGFLLIPFSVLLIKYYPDLGRQYSRWTWTPSFIGVSTDKNGLGVLSLVFGLAALWNLVEALRTETGFERMGRTLAHAVVIGMALFLFQMADSATSVGCVLLGGTVLFCLTLARIERRAIIHCIVVSTVVASVLAYLLLDAGTYMVQALGRDPTLTGRTELWAELLHMPINAWLGTGFGSFWLGDRAQYFWDKYWWRPNEAHNGYLEVYLDLGWIGVGLLVVLIVAGYRNIVQQYPQDPCLGRIRLTFFLTALVYCITEAAFKLMNPVWIAFLLARYPATFRTDPRRERGVPLQVKVGFPRIDAVDIETLNSYGADQSKSLGRLSKECRPLPRQTSVYRQ